jgi:hypothetical protein
MILYPPDLSNKKFAIKIGAGIQTCFYNFVFTLTLMMQAGKKGGGVGKSKSAAVSVPANNSKSGGGGAAPAGLSLEDLEAQVLVWVVIREKGTWGLVFVCVQVLCSG